MIGFVDRRRAPLRWIVRAGVFLSLVLIAAGCGGPEPSLNSPMAAVEAGNLAAVRDLIPARHPAGVRGTFRRTPLHAAAVHGREDVTAYLLRQGAPVNASDSAGVTPLMEAAIGGHPRIFRMLVEHGADTAARDRHGSTVLMHAAAGGDTEVVRRLLDAGAPVDARTPSGASPLMDAAVGGRRDAVELLLLRGADPNVQDRHGGTPVSRALFGGHPSLVGVFLRSGYDPARFPDSPGLVHAVLGGRKKVTRQLLERGANPDAAWDGLPAPLAAAGWKHPDLLERLLAHGADPNVRSRPPRQPDVTPLMVGASRPGNRSVLRVLVEAGAHLDAADYRGRTPLMYAALNGRAQNVRFLLRQGADPEQEDRDGLTARDLARRRDRVRVLRTLRRFSR